MRENIIDLFTKEAIDSTRHILSRHLKCSEDINVFSSANIDMLSNKLHDVLSDLSLVGYHYTRACCDSIKNTGLLIRSGEEIRDQFRQDHFSLFSKEEQNRIEKYWEKYYTGFRKTQRDKKLWFCLTGYSYSKGLCNNLVSYFGGEQIYMAIPKGDVLRQKLAEIGTPLCVKCTLRFHDINHPSTESIVKNIISFLCENSPQTIDVSQLHPVFPCDIIEIDRISERQYAVNSGL